MRSIKVQAPRYLLHCTNSSKQETIKVGTVSFMGPPSRGINSMKEGGKQDKAPQSFNHQGSRGERLRGS